jgi:uncharacterized lipoprotein YmbA
VAGCGTSPPTHFYALRLDVPQDADGSADATPGGTGQLQGETWEVSPSVALPPGLDRDTLMVAAGAAGLEPLAGHRWAAPLRETVPRLLLLDLQRLRGPGRVWAAPAPAGVQPARRLRMELLQFQAGPDRSRLTLQAQWAWQAPDAATQATASAPRMVEATLDLRLADASVDTLAAGHRLLLWRLAQRVVATAGTSR